MVDEVPTPSGDTVLSQTDDFPTMPGVVITDTEGMENPEDGHISFEGLPNTRDLGGIVGAEGRVIKRDRLLRSGALHRATERDVRTLLNDYALRMVVDLRTEEERREHPDPQDALMDVRFVDAPVLGASTLGITREGGMREALKMIRSVKENPAQIMMDIYPRMLLEEESQEGFKLFFEAILDTEEGSVLWHCTAGKDRAGLASALLLHILGASRESIMKNYEATTRYLSSRTEEVMETLATYHLAGKLDESIQVLNSADPRFLAAALDAVEEKYGSLDAYVEQALGITPEKRQLLQERYLD